MRFFTTQEINAYADPLGIARMDGLNTLRRIAAKRPVFLFGCGFFGKSMSQAFNVAYSGFVDNNPKLWGTAINGLPVVNPAETARKYPDVLFLIASTARQTYFEMLRQCRELGVEHRAFIEYWIRDLQGPANPAEVEKDENLWLGYQRMADDLSRETYRGLARFWGNRDIEETPRVFPTQYFVEVVPTRYYRCFADVGAYDGDTLRMHIATMPQGFDRYYAIEAEKANYAHFSPDPSTTSNLELFPVAASNKAGALDWNYGGGSSHAIAGGEDSVRCDRLDSILAGRPVTMIKMDIEGHELLALEGASGIIREQRPALAICVYHRYEHLWQVPAWIDSQLPGKYRFYLRHHLWGFMETVCYAVPV